MIKIRGEYWGTDGDGFHLIVGIGCDQGVCLTDEEAQLLYRDLGYYLEEKKAEKWQI